MEHKWYQLDTQEALRRQQTGPEGLSAAEAAERSRQYGANELEGRKERSRLSLFIDQFRNVMILILVGAAVISFLAGEHTDAIIILAIILGNSILGFIQEYGAEQSLRQLQQMTAQNAQVVRGGATVSIPAAELVPGDIIRLEAGNIVPADARLLEANALKLEEAALTGESLPVGKTIAPMEKGDLLPADQHNMVFKGSSVRNGSAMALVVATGMKTEIGKIAQMLQGERPQTPLQKRLAAFSRQLALVVLVICLIVFGLGLLRGEPMLQMFLTALSLAVAALPEALPAVITIALSRGAGRMVKQQALIRRLPAVETLGSVTYICSDKTGTLTKNQMTVERIEAIPGKENLLLRAMLLNNEVHTTENGELSGDPTETALVEYALSKGLTQETISQELPLERSLPFDSERMMMSTLHRYGERWLLLVKGAPARILEKLQPLEEGLKDQWLEQNRVWASEGLRVLFFACRVFDQKPTYETGAEQMEEQLSLVGMTGMIDPPREEVVEAIEQCHQAGIRTVMITGDQPLTAQAIAQRLNILSNENDLVVTGKELGQLSKEELAGKVRNTSVYARVSPEQKLEIVQTLQADGAFVAMTGDGVNDAPSLKKADIGIAMGITGTDVSKEAADMVLLDDNFATIVRAVREGRRIYDNIIKFIQYVLSCNLGEILIVLCAPLAGLPIPLLPIHILWINLVTDGLPGLALASEPAEASIMKRPPRAPDEPLFSKGLAGNIIITGLLLAAASFVVQFQASRAGYSVAAQQTMVFSTLCFTQLGNALSVRNRHTFALMHLNRNLFLLITVLATVALQLLLIYVPVLNSVFRTVALDLHAITMVAAVSTCSTVAIDLTKRLSIGAKS